MILRPNRWQPLAQAHYERAYALTEPHLQRRRGGEQHPIFDFLYEYYPIRVSHIRRWHPGIGVDLIDAPEHASWRYYRKDGDVTSIDVDAYFAKRGKAVDFIAELLTRTTENPAHFDCFGLHEWAMVYETGQPRHSLPLRLGVQGTNEVVESHSLRCTHYDAFRFFTPPARPLNFQVLSRQTQRGCEQQGCLHATMDLYKWCAKLEPIIPGDLWLDTFELAIDCRVLDMQASPYDCRKYGFEPISIETPAGKAEYVRLQREFANRGMQLRTRMLEVIENAKEMIKARTL
ncbi:MAG: 3-methyladenine DNA glycosylase [Corynebacterium sp.]|nr:3-methyladenine DNA glycosylase [Corynebacterium sp.]